MATDHEQTPRKLVYLRDHSQRLRTRTVRPERKPPPSPHPELASEAAWLGRSLMLVSAGIAVYWLLILSGAIHPEGGAAWTWTVSHSLAQIFVALAAALAARLLLRAAPRAPLFVAIAAGGLIVTSIEGLAHLVINGDLSQISLSVRTDILTRSGMLAVGVWAGSFALRADRRTA